MHIYIKTHTGKTLSFDAQPCDTILCLKKDIHKQIGLHHTLQRLMFEGNQLTDHSTLIQYQIQDQSILSLVPKKEDMLIFIKTLTGKILSIDVDLHGTVEELKMKIEEKEGIPVNSQRLVFVGYVLSNNSRTLASYNIKEQSHVHLILMMQGGM